ncbi:MAG: cation diffusion facilitator family transporter [Candidatus Altiarchaeota archaeon]
MASCRKRLSQLHAKITGTSEMQSKLREGERTAIISAAATLLLTIVKGGVGILSGSLALTADALHSLTDVVSTVAVWVGLRISQKKPDERFTYGYYKAETIASLVVALMILLAGLEILKESYTAFMNPSPLKLAYIALLVSLVSAVGSYALMKYKLGVGKRINSPALIADAKHSGVDVYASLVVFVGILSSHLGFPQLEAIAGVLVSLLVLKVAVLMGKDSLLVLMDACLCPELGEKIKAIIRGVEGVSEVRDVKLRRSGPYVFGEAKVTMSGDLSVARSHEQTEKIEAVIKDSIKDVDSFTIHVEPAKLKSVRIGLPVIEDAGLDSNLSPQFSKTPYFMFVDVDGNQVKGMKVLENPAKNLEKKIGMTAAKFLVDNKINVLIAREVGEGAYYALKEHLVETYLFEGQTVKDAIKNFTEGKLQRKEAGL